MPLLHVQAGSAAQLQGIADALWKARKVVVITGAGISTNSGIPDFRSENGLYSMIQSQFDAASKLGIPKTELSGVSSDERPRKRRKTTPPIQDSIEVAPEHGTSPASLSNCLAVRAKADLSATDIEASIEVEPTKSSGLLSPSVHDAVGVQAGDRATNFESSTKAKSRDGNAELPLRGHAEPIGHSNKETDVIDDEVVLLSEESAVADEHLLFGADNGRGGGSGAKDEVADPPGDVAEESLTTHEDMQDRTAQALPQAAVQAILSRGPSQRHSRLNTPPRDLSSATKTSEEDHTQQPLTAPLTTHFTPNPASSSGSGPQTTSSSPLSSPPPAELFDSFNEPSTDPPPSSSRPSSPISTEDDDDEFTKYEGEDNEPSRSREYVNRPSNFRRSLSTLKGKELFDASIWADPVKTSVFYTFATNLRQRSRDADPTGCHQFIGHLSKAGKMVRCYTQNIDLLEDKVGLSTRLLLGAGSRSRFSTRTAKGITSFGAAEPKDPNHSNTQPIVTVVPSGLCSGSSSQPGMDATAASQEATPASSQVPPSQLQSSINIDHQPGNSADRGLVEGHSEQVRERGEECEQDHAKTDAQPFDAGSTTPSKPLSGTEGAAPTTPEIDRGVECVFLHGSLRALRCFQCGCVADWEGDRELQTMSGQQPPCPRCEDATNARQERGKRALGVGKLRPDIVLYGEDHPESQQISSIIQHDISLAPDMLIIMGTSLKVHGLKTVVREFAKTVHNRKDGKVVFVNYTKPAESIWADIIDFWVEMDCDSWVEDLKEKKPIIWMPPGSVESEPRTATSKRRRPPTDGSDKKEAKKPKKAENTAQVAISSSPQEGKKSKQAKKVELPKSTEAKPAPKRPAAHRDCKQNAAYWTAKIRITLASMVGREVVPLAPGPSLHMTVPTAQDATQNTFLATGSQATDTTAPTPMVAGRRPRTKNTISRKAPEAPGTSTLSAGKQKRAIKKGKSKVLPTAKAPPKRRTNKAETAPASKTLGDDTASTRDHLPKQDCEAVPHFTVLNEVAVPNSGPSLAGEDIPMVAVVKNRTRKPKIHYGESAPSPIAPTQRKAPAQGGARSMARAGPPRKDTKSAQLQQTGAPSRPFQDVAGRNWSEVQVLRPIIQPRQQPQAPCAPITLPPINQPDTTRRRASYFETVLAQPSSPEYLEPAIRPPPETSPKWMSPNNLQHRFETFQPVTSSDAQDEVLELSPTHWQRQAFAYDNALFRGERPLSLDIPRSGGAGDAGLVRPPVAVPPQQMVLGDAAPLLGSPSIVPDLAPPVAASSVPDTSPNRQLQRDSEAAVYDKRQFVRI